MSKLADLAFQSAAYDEYVEQQRQAVRLEGAEELRVELLRMIAAEKQFATIEMSVAFDRAIHCIERASI